MKGYKHRVFDELLANKLMSKGAVLVEGPKWSGKTTTAQEIASSSVMLSNAKVLNHFRSLLEIEPDLALSCKAPMLIDEWQNVPRVWDVIRYIVDHRHGMGHFILTGSSSPNKEAKKEILHSGTGRFAWLRMRPMSLWESGESTGEVSLSNLFDSPNQIYGKKEITLEELAFIICRGGWPKVTSLTKTLALKRVYDYYIAITKEGLRKVDGIKRSSKKVQLLMRAYARYQTTQASIAKLLKEMKNKDFSTLDENTINSYLEALRKMFIIEDMPAWCPCLRSKTPIRTKDTRYFVDPSIATAALGLGPKDLINDFNTMCLFFETLCIRDLRVFAEALNGKVYHYRDKNGLECDAIVQIRKGLYGLIEIKLGGEKSIEEGVKSLKKLASIIDTSKQKAPSFLMVLVGLGEYAYRRLDGVYVVPIGCLKN